ncbi:sulfatase-like hydrolase/transferase, partial [Thiotrichales bacterium HSG1]|nr:sulfatase-like hydrolase/transferase [Thiotrichales bacterium HSG1]
MYEQLVEPINTSEFDISKLSELGLNSDAITPKRLSATAGKNLVFIYLESLESIYLEETIFPELTPNIKNFITTGLSFTNMYQTNGTGWTIAGIVSSQCGTPLLDNNSIANGNDILQADLLVNAICLGDVLNKAGYVQEYMGGASGKFAGKKSFFNNHKYDKISGLNDLVTDNNSYGWGIYDDALFQIAAKKYVQLADNNKPFNLTLLTLDTHHPEGRPSPSCKAYAHRDDSILNAVYCTDQL